MTNTFGLASEPAQTNMSPYRSHLATSNILTSKGYDFCFFDWDGFANLYDIQDIAHALSNLCRFTGHTREFYSVATHSVHVSRIVPRQHALAGLLHDAAEAYLGDVSSPLKALLPDYKKLERFFEAQIFKHFGLPAELPPEVKQADQIMLATEMRDLMPVTARDMAGLAAQGIKAHPDLTAYPQVPSVAKDAFLRRFQELTI